jgi:hypothetical protein
MIIMMVIVIILPYFCLKANYMLILICVSMCSAKVGKVMLYGIEESKCLLLLWNVCDMFEETLVK